MQEKVGRVVVKRVGFKQDELEDLVVVEEPMEIRLMHGPKKDRKEFSLSVTMRTPGNDYELCLGFLFTEGIINSLSQVIDIRYCETVKEEEQGNVVKVSLAEEVELDELHFERHFYTSSSCGVCGKSSIDAVKTTNDNIVNKSKVNWSEKVILELSGKIGSEQLVFKHTGGIHAASIIDNSGHIIYSREDIGRHNAVDKLIGASLKTHSLPLEDYLLWVSGRAGFELIQKAVMAGFGAFASVGAPSNLSVQLAKEHNLLLIGFLREGRFNIYHGEERVMA